MYDDEIDTEVLIALVEDRPVLWDKIEVIYKDRNATRKAWEEVCNALNEDFEMLQEKEKNAFTKEVMRRWSNIRDSFGKFCRKEQDVKKSGDRASKFKKYIYNDQLKFLKKLYETREVVENYIEPPITENEVAKSLSGDEDHSAEPTVSSRLVSRSKKRKTLDEFKLRMLKALDSEKPNRHLSFFKGIIPALEAFNEQEVLKFQKGVLQLKENINDEKRVASYNEFCPDYHPISQSRILTAPSTAPSTSAMYHSLHHPFHPHYFGQRSASSVDLNPPPECLSSSSSINSINSVDVTNL